jgi:hypothetical protein
MLWTKENLFRRDIVINCATAEQAKVLLDWTESIGKSWYGSTRDNYWNSYKANTCYKLIYKSYCNINYFQANSHTIIKFTDLTLPIIVSKRA